MPLAFNPLNLKMFNATLLWRPHFWIAIAMINPPANKNWTLFIYSLLITPISTTPNKGKSTNGIKAVTWSGRASNAHQIPIKEKTARVNLPSVDNPIGFWIIKMNIKEIRPNQKPTDFIFQEFIINFKLKYIYFFIK